jgi:hypothetical protein
VSVQIRSLERSPGRAWASRLRYPVNSAQGSTPGSIWFARRYSSPQLPAVIHRRSTAKRRTRSPSGQLFDTVLEAQVLVSDRRIEYGCKSSGSCRVPSFGDELAI